MRDIGISITLFNSSGISTLVQIQLKIFMLAENILELSDMKSHAAKQP